VAGNKDSKQVKLKRIFTHLFYPNWRLKKLFPQSALDDIETAITHSEALHRGEICVAIECSLSLSATTSNQSLTDRALEVFSLLRVWDTENNNGVLIYLLLAEQRIKIIADRNINNKVEEQQWQEICTTLALAFQQEQYSMGMNDAIKQVGQLLAEHFPKTGNNVNELSNKAKLL